jgi:hypothetical protein
MKKGILLSLLILSLAVVSDAGAAGKKGKGKKTKAAAQQPAAEQGWVSLFDGKTLDGWEVKSGYATYRVEDGAIVGTTAEKSPNTFLCTKKEYCDFVLEFEVKCDPALNSGVQFRSHAYQKEVSKEGVNPQGKKVTRTWPAGRVYGYQAEIADTGNAGRIYDEAARATWLDTAPEDKSVYKADDWNKYRIECQGDHIRTWVNGVLRADIHDSRDKCGLIGLQVHQVNPYKKLEVRWRNIRIKEL